MSLALTASHCIVKSWGRSEINNFVIYSTVDAELVWLWAHASLLPAKVVRGSKCATGPRTS